LTNPQQARPIIRKLIEPHGQSDREQFCVPLLNVKKRDRWTEPTSWPPVVSSAQVCPREVLKPAILANSAAIILCHNHASRDVYPSVEDQALTEVIIRAAAIIGIQVHEHLIVSMTDDRYYSFSDNGIIRNIYNAISAEADNFSLRLGCPKPPHKALRNLDPAASPRRPPAAGIPDKEPLARKAAS
jgi:DNA repair protein RadC